MMRRRELISLGRRGSLAAHRARATAGAALSDRVPRVDRSPTVLLARLEAFRAGLRDLGYQEGRNVVIEYRWADGKYDRLPALFAELIGLRVDVIVTHGTPGGMAAKQATSTIPIVMAAVGDALGSGLVSSLARPGGNVTGLTFFQPELLAKRLELLKEAMPRSDAMSASC